MFPPVPHPSLSLITPPQISHRIDLLEQGFRPPLGLPVGPFGGESLARIGAFGHQVQGSFPPSFTA